MLCIRVTLKTLHLISFNFRLTFLECCSTVLRSVFKRSGSVSELIVLKIIPKKVIQCLFCSVMTLSVDQTIVLIKKEKLDGSHGNDVGETRIYQRQKSGT